YLYFFASTTAGPVVNWFSLENDELTITRAIYMAVLRKDLPSPLVKESDEEKGAAAAKSDEKTSEKKEEAAKEEKKDKTDVKSNEKPKPAPAVEPVKIDFDGIDYRILDLPVPAAQLSSLSVGETGQVFYLRTADEKTALERFDLKERKTDTLLA